jgi:polar amino acid transport system permease protein
MDPRSRARVFPYKEDIMEARALERPERGLQWVFEQSTRLSLATLCVGIVALALVLVGMPAIITAKGWTPVQSLIAAMKSFDLRVLLATTTALGLIAAAGGWSIYRRMPTKVSREQAIGGAVLGLQAAVLGGFFLWFVSGDVRIFAINYLDFRILSDQFGFFLNAAKNTVVLAFTSQAIGMSLGLVLALFAISQRGVVRAPARAYINFFRGTPLVWQIIFIGVGIPIGLRVRIDPYQAAIAALALNTAAYAAEVFRAGIQSIERGQLEAARGLGMSYLQAMRYAIVPLAVRRVIPPLMNEFVILIKDTSLIIVLGLTFSERELMSFGKFGTANTANATYLIATAIGYLAVTLPLIRIVNALEKRLRSGLVGVTG